MRQRCVYCGYKEGTTKDHIVPKSFWRNHAIEQLPRLNMAPSCVWCNRDKADNLYLPTKDNIKGIYSHMPTKYLLSVASWVYKERNNLETIVLEQYGSSQEDVEQVVTLYLEGYYYRLTQLYGENNPVPADNQF